MTTESTSQAAGKLGLIALIGVVVSSMIGGGIFSLPQNMSASAGLGAVMIAWLITGVGMFFIANTFRILSDVRPDLKAGIYMYAREGFGPFVGFTIAWGYWLCQIFGNVGYAVITMDALDYFFPGVFTGGNNLYSIIGGSILIWVFNFLVLSGVKQAGSMNVIGTIAKLVPLAVFIVITAFVFDFAKIDFDFWGQMSGGGEKPLGGITSQIQSTMLVTLWAFIGIEGAVVLSGRARNQSDVGRATLLGFVGALAVYVLLSVLPFGTMHQAELATIANPSTAGVLEHLVGPWGAWLMNIGLIIAVLTSWLAWTMIVAEIPYAAGVNGTFPKVFARENKHGSASVSLWVTSAVMQVAMLVVFFASNAWNTMLSITGVMVLPAYFACTLYLWKVCEDHEYDAKAKTGRAFALGSGILGSIYAVWLIYAAGLQYLLLALAFLACGVPFFIWARKEKRDGQPIFLGYEKWLVGILLIIAIVGIVLFARGIVKL